MLDCANGAASVVAPAVLERLGVAHKVLFAEPNGLNINAGCGSTHLRALKKAVVASGAAVGVALDGDADRMLAVDHTGELVDGDQLMAMFAIDLVERGELDGGSIVVTVMSNLGLRQALSRRGSASSRPRSGTVSSPMPSSRTASSSVANNPAISFSVAMAKPATGS